MRAYLRRILAALTTDGMDLDRTENAVRDGSLASRWRGGATCYSGGGDGGGEFICVLASQLTGSPTQGARAGAADAE
ncbi:MAG: hypothetical protein KGL35_12020 [Bradyrhizobium sp.]|nr:hypothetical protein [Bradyrhizobium sp.]